MSMKYETIVYQRRRSRRDGDAEPPRLHNAMNDVMRRRAHALFEGLGDDDDVKVVVVTGAGERRYSRARTSASSSGARAREFASIAAAWTFASMDRCRSRSSPPSTARLGGGLEWRSRCDIRIAPPARRWDSRDHPRIIPGRRPGHAAAAATGDAARRSR